MRPDATEPNRRLTASTAVALLVLLAAEGLTIVFLRPLFTLHVFIGMLLLPPIALKLASTGWRFSRYYLGHPDYRDAGPPPLLLRLTAPFLVLATAGVFGTGVAMLALGPSSSGLIGLHKATFIVWFFATGAHVLAHMWRVPALVRRAAKPQHLLVLAALVAGLAVAGATAPLIHPWQSWVSQHRREHE